MIRSHRVPLKFRYSAYETWLAYPRVDEVPEVSELSTSMDMIIQSLGLSLERDAVRVLGGT